MSQKNLFWVIPLLFVACLSFQIGVFFYVQNEMPEFKNIGFPTTFEQAQQVSALMNKYLQSHYYTLLFFEISNFLFLQAWCIPGTFIFNLLGGSLFGVYVGFPICLACNTLGAFCSFSISKYLAKDVIQRRFSEKLKIIQNQIEKHRNDLFYYMLSTRVFPGSPNWLMNISLGHLNVPSHYFILSIAIGLIPWNFLTCQAGAIIAQYTTKDQIIQRETYIFLILISIAIIIPPIVKNYLKRKESQQTHIE